MTTALYTHPASLYHVTPPGHPEQVARIEAITAALADPAFEGLTRLSAPLAEEAHLLRGHPAQYISHIRASEPANGFLALDADTHMSSGSVEAALRAVGANVAAVELVMKGAAANAFCALRPPGHHAEVELPMGFCLFGTVALGAKHALEACGAERVAVIDFDVHHGNGTQALLWHESRSLFVSSHQSPLWPGTGAPEERGAHGNVMNVPLAPDSSGQLMRAVYEGEILPAVLAFKPDLILISAGFDAHRADPLASLNWETEDFAWLTHRICDVADEVCSGRIVSSLEGGYDLDALGESVAAHVAVLMERAG
ncbi:histone deacetylase family protein [Pseudoruegeria sp. SHC-113]|uniref:histone deacetylase family protein n=1 Tax=Pseudoruegeria sp. SHC-113 TaxID=2855439 RepID=UPI0021BAC094|nr:histone deacetylase family protein [Pseudoruegeria sp. SHC-113]MCT8158716.1 histone deacetylase family protein [Pseudoruegeria sp. SHC-113]